MAFGHVALRIAFAVWALRAAFCPEALHTAFAEVLCMLLLVRKLHVQACCFGLVRAFCFEAYMTVMLLMPRWPWPAFVMPCWQ